MTAARLWMTPQVGCSFSDEPGSSKERHVSATRVDVEAYLSRIGFHDPLAADRATLSALIQHHAAAIPFENIEVLAGRVPALDLASLQRKMVQGQRGGYCFEQNALFLAVLQATGFDAAGLEARVRAGVPVGTITGRTHMTIRVSLLGEQYLADVGFGGLAPLAALKIDPQPQTCPDGATYRVVREGDLALQVRTSEGWVD